MANKPGYFSKYYEENKAEINEKRRQRYEEDPEYKQRVLKSSREYRRRKRERDGGERKVRAPRFAKPLVVKTGDGGTIELYSVGFVARLLRRNVQTINHWEKAGVLPPTPYRDERGFRFYTIAMIGAIRDAVSHKRRLFPVDDSIRKAIESAWREQGVPTKAGSMKSAVKRTVTKT